MNKGGKFSTYEGILFVTITIVSKILYTSTPAVVKQAGTAAWYSTLISCAAAILQYWLMCKLIDRFQGKDLVEVTELVLGKFIGKIMGVLLSGYVVYYAATNLREFLEMIKAFNLPSTPPSVIMITFISVCVLIAYKGLETIVRISYVNFFVIITALIIILLLAIPYYDIDYIKPYFGYGFTKTLSLGFLRSSAYEEVTLLLMINRSLHNSDYKKIGIVSLILSGIIFSISLLCYLMAYGYDMGRENFSGIFQLSRIIYYNRYIQRVESIFLFAWVISSLLTVSTAFYTSVRVYCQSFEISDHKPILAPFAMIMYALTLQPKNVSELMDINLLVVRQYSMLLTFVFPILVLLIAVIFRKKGIDSNV
ncbi:GerAB/ArcD/ProY family transporter [Clostridium oryzae]|uniref:Spore germination protein A2 n=1 Tax=Clostridium oryzae TaxID=1450648 RepID=A0A1V4I6Z2_9CLOT|nr:endospore germination permease [Clostridium oryzae]OPJ55736.1 spore germination protein A2 [Clostridium oryzae]